MGMLEKEPEARYPDAKALAEDLLELCTQADSSWRVPLFPGSGPEKSPAALAPAVPRRRLPVRWWAAGIILTVALLLGVPPGDTPRTASSPSPATPEGSSGQEVEATASTAEVVPGAAPEKALTPAPIHHSEAPPMLNKPLLKSRKARSLLAAGCVVGSAGCVSGPQPRPLPPPAECPPGAAAAHKRFGVWPGAVLGASLIPIRGRPQIVPVRDGQQVRAEIIGQWGQLPQLTTFDGRLYLGADRVYGRFTKATLPTGETVPVCLEVMFIGERERGTPVEPGSTATQALVISSMSVQAVERFE